jgi:hypothetical protein
VVLLSGGSVPFILRPIQEGYKYVGPAYVQVVMLGEEWPKDESDESFEFLL